MKNLVFTLLIFFIPISIISQQKPDYFKKLNSKERNVIVNKGTEYPNTGKYNKHFEKKKEGCTRKNPLSFGRTGKESFFVYYFFLLDF